MTKVTQKPTALNAKKRAYRSYYKARNAWQEIISAFTKNHPDAVVILPAYIGFSVKEGSGIFDPVSNLDAPYKFYGLNKLLRIDFEDFKKVVLTENNPIVLLAHYFGFPDDNFKTIVNWLDENNIYYVEDSAHAMLTDVIGGACGRNGAYNIYSLHKMLPYEVGGMLVDNHINSLPIADTENYLDIAEVFTYDLKTIYDIRRENYQFLIEQLKDVKGITLLYPKLEDGVCPQSLPMLIDSVDRNTVYFEMNKLGFGLVSLYHTMIDELKNTPYESTNYAADNITNFPVHQDCSIKDLEALVTAFKKML